MADLTLAQFLAILGLAGLMLLGATRGHQRGPIRQLAAPLAGVVGGLIGVWIGPTFGHAWLGEVGLPWITRGPLGILMVGLITWLLALALFWKMGKPSSATGESDNPVLGAIIGCWTGMMAWLVFLTTLAQYQAWERELAPTPTAEISTTKQIAGLPLMSWLGEMEPWPASLREILRTSRKVFASPSATARLMKNPRVRALASHPSFYPAWGDVEVKQLVRSGNYRGVLEHPKVKTLLADEGFQQELAGFDALEALKGALKE